MKTCLWNMKNNKGAKITKKLKVTRDTVDVTDNQEVLQREDSSVQSPDTDIYLEELMPRLTAPEAVIVKCVLEDPNFIKPSGKANVSALAKVLGKSWNEVNIILKDISRKIGNEL